MTGYVPLRRGLIEHLEQGRITSDEFAAFTLALMKADHKTGKWKSNGTAIAKLMHWEERKGRRVLQTLAAKCYLGVRRLPGLRGSTYEIHIPKYFHRTAQQSQPITGQKEHADPPITGQKEPPLLQEEVLQEERLIPRTPRAGSPPVQKTGNQDYERRLAAKSKRLALKRAGFPRDRRYDAELKRKRQNEAIDDWIEKQRAAGNPPMTPRQILNRLESFRRAGEGSG